MKNKRPPLYILIRLVSQQLRKRADETLMASAGLTTAQSAVMTIIASKNSVSQREVAEILHQRESAITTMSDRLVSAGLITKTRSTKDKRAWNLKPTQKGRSSLESLKEELFNIDLWFDEAMSADERETVAAGLYKTLQVLERPK